MKAQKFREEQGKTTVYHHKSSVDILMKDFANHENKFMVGQCDEYKQKVDSLKGMLAGANVEIKELRGLLDKVKGTLPEWDKIYPVLAEKNKGFLSIIFLQQD